MQPSSGSEHASEIVYTSFRACPAEISRQISTMRRVFRNHGFTECLRDRVILVLAEVLNNIAEHSMPDHDGRVLLLVAEDDGRLLVRTEDAGGALPSRLLGQPDLPEMGSTIEDLPEGGFGWFIIHSLVDDMIYERHEGKNCLSFSFASG